MRLSGGIVDDEMETAEEENVVERGAEVEGGFQGDGGLGRKGKMNLRSAWWSS